MQSNALKPETDFVVHGEISPSLRAKLKTYIPLLAHDKFRGVYSRSLKQPTRVTTKSIVDYIGTVRLLTLYMGSDNALECDRGMIRAMVNKMVKKPFYEHVEAPECILRDVTNTLGIDLQSQKEELISLHLKILPDEKLVWYRYPVYVSGERKNVLSFKDWQEESRSFLKCLQSYYKEVYDIKENQCIHLRFGFKNDKWLLMLNQPKSN